MNDANLKDAMMQNGLIRSPDSPGMSEMTPQKDFSSPAPGIQTRPLTPTNELALARQMGVSPDRYRAITGRPYPVAEQQSQPGQSVATPRTAIPTAQRGKTPEKNSLARDNFTFADLIKEELARQRNIGPDEPISALDRAKLRAGALVGGLRSDRDKDPQVVRRTKRND